MSLDGNELKSINALKNALIEPPVHTLSDTSDQRVNDINACDVRVGCKLLHQPANGTKTQLITGIELSPLPEAGTKQHN